MLLLLLQGDVAVLKRDYDQRLDSLTAQLVASEDVLGTKENQIQSLQQRVKDFDGLKHQLVQQQQEIEALQAQVAETISSFCVPRTPYVTVYPGFFIRGCM